MSLQATVIDRQRGRRIDRAVLQRFLVRLAFHLGPPSAITMAVCLVSDRRMRALNRAFRGVDAPTDVLSFVGEDGPDPDGCRHLGDVVISVPTAARQAGKAGHPLARELKLLALHGYLHLLGYDHETDHGRMMRVQRRIEGELLPRPGRN